MKNGNSFLLLLAFIMLTCYTGMNANAQADKTTQLKSELGKVLLKSKTIEGNLVTYKISIPSMDDRFVAESKNIDLTVFETVMLNRNEREITVVVRLNTMPDNSVLNVFRSIEVKIFCPHYPLTPNGQGPGQQATGAFNAWKSDYPEEYRIYNSIFNFTAQ